MSQIIYAVIYLAITVAAFLLGKYVAPKLLTSETLNYLSAWVYKFVISAKNQYDGGKGTEKREYVTTLIKELCKKAHIELTGDQIRALIEEAYQQMKAGEEQA